MRGTIHSLVLCLLFAQVGAQSSSAAQPDPADDIADAIIGEIRTSLPQSAAAMSSLDMLAIRQVTNLLLNSSYFPPDAGTAHAQARKAVREASNESATARSLTMVALRALVAVAGHGSRIDARGAVPDEQPAAVLQPLPVAAGVALLDLRNIHFDQVDGQSRCPRIAGLVYRMLDDQDHAAVLDLRGNEGGRLSDIICIASIFVPNRVVLFQTATRHGKDSFDSRPVPGPLQHLPLSIVIDERTDSGGLLLAAVLQDQGRGEVTGMQKQTINGAVHSTVSVPEYGLVTLPVGVIFHGPDLQLLSNGIHVP
jgi:hypothetical protein